MSSAIAIIEKIKERKTGFKVTDDFPIPDLLILSMMNEVREVLIREEKNNTGKISDQYYQFSCCYKIECVTHTCTFNGREVTVSTPIYKVVFPELVSKIDNLDIKYIGNDSGTKYNRYSFDGFWTIKNRLWTKNSRGYTHVGNEVLINRLITPGQNFICAMLLLKDPTTACNWDSEKTTYPVPSEMKLIDMVLYRLRSGAHDVLNNAADDLTPPKIEEAVVAGQKKQAEQQQKQ